MITTPLACTVIGLLFAFFAFGGVGLLAILQAGDVNSLRHRESAGWCRRHREA